MAAILTHDCPHCGTRSVAFTCIEMTVETKPESQSAFYVWTLLSCGRCTKGALASLSIYSGRFRDSYALAGRSEFKGSFAELGFELESFYPDDAVGSAPDHTPDRPRHLFDQASTNYSNNNWDASGAMSRKCLDVATKLIARERIHDDDEREAVLKAWLKKRIDLLKDLGLLSDDVASLALVIKNGGDDAAHDEEPYTQEEARALLEFSKVFLTYAFTIPGMVASVAVPVGEEEGT